MTQSKGVMEPFFKVPISLEFHVFWCQHPVERRRFALGQRGLEGAADLRLVEPQPHSVWVCLTQNVRQWFVFPPRKLPAKETKHITKLNPRTTH